ncbi:3-deoxy-7-phosphoheptulonate synthase [Saccharothrix sp. NRRL B-16314]|uniref:3-deoxy-7-phosphoheptulonate synthase n=1 Tax=Saccharothrix sp. NRRL B-16314 TaxID=1463825 RepID=UPI0018CBF644|nr:3-deoxy-7-phosphoheptulonate synthase [Saccharothrix sp. NRRL B-16314]
MIRESPAAAVRAAMTERTARQQPVWPDRDALDLVEAELTDLPGLTTEDEVVDLARGMTLVAEGAGLVLQGGDCAERFHEAVPELVRRKVDHLQGLAAMLRAGSGLIGVAIGRLAGQYGKPRSSPFEPDPEEVGRTMASYCGDAVNDPAPDPARRVPDPRRLRTAYDSSQVVLREVRRAWCGKPLEERVYAAHELLLLPYERSLVRDGVRGAFSAAAHFGWIGERTRGLGDAHVALAAGVHNPIGVKIGPTASPDDVVALTRVLNPDGVPGRLSLILRYGADDVDRMLPPVVSAVARQGAPVVWLCDPMHGNGLKLHGVKTRLVESMLAEVTSFVRVLVGHGQRPAGLHLELTPDPVTECVSPQVANPTFPDYRSTCDPRLNPEQSVALIAHFLDRLSWSG